MSSVELARLPIFPLPRAFLFPHAVLPLHVFEPRYRQLLADCLAGDRMMGIACLQGPDEPDDPFDLPGAAELARPMVRRMVGVGTVVAHEPLPDGRSNILLRGLGRARIEEELDEAGRRPYRVVRALWARDRPLALDRAQAIRQTLAALAAQLADRLPEGGDTLRSLVHTHGEAGPLSDLLCAALVTQPEERLRMFETLDVPRRGDGVAAAIGVALATLAGRAGPAN
jgi:Lon protease-like protein